MSAQLPWKERVERVRTNALSNARMTSWDSVQVAESCTRLRARVRVTLQGVFLVAVHIAD